MSKRDPRVRGAVETVREAFVMNDLDTILILVRKQEAERDQLREERDASYESEATLAQEVDRYRAALEKVRRQALHGVSLTACEACRANEITVYHALSADSTEAPQEASHPADDGVTPSMMQPQWRPEA